MVYLRLIIEFQFGCFCVWVWNGILFVAYLCGNFLIVCLGLLDLRFAWRSAYYGCTVFDGRCLGLLCVAYEVGVG